MVTAAAPSGSGHGVRHGRVGAEPPSQRGTCGRGDGSNSCQRCREDSLQGAQVMASPPVPHDRGLQQRLAASDCAGQHSRGDQYRRRAGQGSQQKDGGGTGSGDSRQPGAGRDGAEQQPAADLARAHQTQSQRGRGVIGAFFGQQGDDVQRHGVETETEQDHKCLQAKEFRAASGGADTCPRRGRRVFVRGTDPGSVEVAGVQRHGDQAEQSGEDQERDPPAEPAAEGGSGGGENGGRESGDEGQDRQRTDAGWSVPAADHGEGRLVEDRCLRGASQHPGRKERGQVRCHRHHDEGQHAHQGSADHQCARPGPVQDPAHEDARHRRDQQTGGKGTRHQGRVPAGVLADGPDRRDQRIVEHAPPGRSGSRTARPGRRACTHRARIRGACAGTVSTRRAPRTASGPGP